MYNKLFIGIDPGTQGYIACFDDEGWSYFPTPLIGKEYDNNKLSNIFNNFRDIYGCFNIQICLESPSPDPNWGAKVNWSLGGCMQMFKQVCADYELALTCVPPKTWQKEMWQGVKVQKKASSTGKTMVIDTKATSLIAAKRLFPSYNFDVTNKGNKSKNANDNLVDATLIAEYCRRKFK